MPERNTSAGRAWTLRVLFSGDAPTDPRPRLLPLGKTVIGRAPQGPHDMCFEGDSDLSRRHATIERSRNKVTFHDHSRNGSQVNGRKAHDVPLWEGDLIRCGNTFAVVRYEKINPDDAEIEGFMGVSALTCQVRGAIAQVAVSTDTVVLQGETGTGKTVAARAIHELSGRTGRWLHFNCAAVPGRETESALYGHTKGAFPGADEDRPGHFLGASSGTLYIAEVGDLAFDLQPKLLEVLDSGSVTPVGSDVSVPVHTRLVTASGRDLGVEVSKGNLLVELHARLATVVISIPPLRDRIEDLLGILVDRLGEHPPLSPELVDALLQYHWPNNLREVDRIATHLAVRGSGYDELVVELVEGHLQSADLRPDKPVPSHRPPPQRTRHSNS